MSVAQYLKFVPQQDLINELAWQVATIRRAFMQVERRKFLSHIIGVPEHDITNGLGLSEVWNEVWFNKNLGRKPSLPTRYPPTSVRAFHLWRVLTMMSEPDYLAPPGIFIDPKVIDDHLMQVIDYMDVLEKSTDYSCVFWSVIHTKTLENEAVGFYDSFGGWGGGYLGSIEKKCKDIALQYGYDGWTEWSINQLPLMDLLGASLPLTSSLR